MPKRVRTRFWINRI